SEFTTMQLRAEFNQQSILDYITKRYVVALAILALVLIGNQFFIQWMISRPLYDARAINLAGRQQRYSQQISEMALQLSLVGNQPEREQIAQNLEDSVSQWERSYQSL